MRRPRLGTVFEFREPFDDFDPEAFITPYGYTIDYASSSFDQGTGTFVLALVETLTTIQKITVAAGLDDATLVEADGAPGFRASASTYIAMGIGSGAAIVLVTASSKLGVYDSSLALTQIQAADPVAAQDVVTLGYLAAYGGGGSSRPGPAGRDGEDGEEGPPGPRGRRGPTGATGPAGAPASDAHLYAVRTLRAFR